MATSSSPATEPSGSIPSTVQEELVSIVVPCYNVSSHVEKCIASLLAQTYPNLEIIAVNDRSSDDTGAVLDRIAAQESRLRVIHAEVNGGPHGARQLGVQAARGQFIGFVDSDDHVRADMFAGFAKALKDEKADIAICNFLSVDGAGNEDPHIIASRKLIVDDDIIGRFSRLEFGSGMLCNKLFRKAVIQPSFAFSLDRSVDYGEDQIVSIGCFARASRVVLLPEAYYYYLQHPQSGSNRSDNPKAFSLVLNSYVKCLEIYLDQGEQVLAAIDGLYKLQLRFDRYRLESVADLAPHKELLGRALEKLAHIRPGSIYPLIHVFDKRGEEDPPLPLRFHLGQIRISLGKAIKALIKGQA